MVAIDTFFAVFALIPVCLSSTVLPLHDPSPQLLDISASATSHRTAERWLPRARARRGGQEKRDQAEIPLLRKGEDVPVHTTSRIINQRRSLDNGSIINLATAHSTYVVPVIFGSPPAAYPLQLDLGSSDLLLASTLCGDKCPQSDGNSINPYYDAQRRSASFEAVNGNQTWWNVSFADTRTASGFIARENVSIGNSQVPGQVFGLINATNLTLAEQEISGIMGLGFPRLSVIARSLLNRQQSAQASVAVSGASSTSHASSTSAATSAAASPRSSAAYLPTFLESLVTTPHIPYPVFGLALAPPFINSRSTASSSAAPSASARFASYIGSLTLGGVSSLYVSDQPGSGLTREDIEWHAVVPFGRVSSGNDTVQGGSNESVAGSGLSSSSIPSSTSSDASASTSSAPARKRQEASNTASAPSSASGSAAAATPTGAVPQSLRELEEEDYLYWTIQLANVSVNGTDIGLESTYAYLDVPPIALLDAGFNGISGPISQVAKIFDAIPEARQASTGQWAVPCDTKMTLGFSFGGRYVQLQPSEWMYASIASSSFCLAWPVGTGPDSGGIDWQMGTPFLKKVYSIFSYGINGKQAPLVGFLPIADAVAPGSSASTSITASSASSGIAGSVGSSSVPQTSPYGPNPTTIKAYQATATVATELPNAVLPVPTYSLPSYIYDRDSAVTAGALQTLGLANASAYDVGDVPTVLAPNMSDPASTSAGTVGIGGTNTDGGAQGRTGLGRGYSLWTAVLGMAGAWLMAI